VYCSLHRSVIHKALEIFPALQAVNSLLFSLSVSCSEPAGGDRYCVATAIRPLTKLETLESYQE
jgi:hypothetical protein